MIITCAKLAAVRVADVFDVHAIALAGVRMKQRQIIAAFLARDPDATLLDLLISADGVGHRTIARLHARAQTLRGVEQSTTSAQGSAVQPSERDPPPT